MQNWHYDTATDIGQPLAERLRRVPREPDMLIYGLRLLAAILLRGWLRVYHRLQICGRSHLPASGPFVLVANHSSHLDALCLAAAVPLKDVHRTCPVAAADYFFQTPSRAVAAAVALNAVAFDRSVQPRESLNACRELLAGSDTILIFFPEGTRSTTGEIGEFKPGIGALVGGLSVPVVPCRLEGAVRAWPKGRVFPRPTKLRLTIGEPRTFTESPPGKEAGQEIADQLRRSVIALGTSHDH